jgi:lysophospholipase L1-like esterase
MSAFAVVTRQLAVALVGFWLAACDQETVQTTMTTTSLPPLADISDAEWEALASRRIFFGHQSVGANVLDGVRDLMREEPRIRLNIVRSMQPSTVVGPALMESSIGENGNPSSKAQAFLDALTYGVGDNAVVMYKYCYLDVTPGTDADAMFEEYRRTIEAVRGRHAGATIVHITAPLTVEEPAPKRLLKSVLGKPTQRSLNGKRARFNTLLRETYGGVDPVFDLARVEAGGSTPDGAPSALSPVLSDDGGHLNVLGRRLAAAELLRVLATLAPPMATAKLTAERGVPTRVR